MRGKESAWLDRTSSKFCFCCHVRTGTIVLGIWHIVVELLVIGLLMIAMIHPDVLGGNNSMNGSLTIHNDAVQISQDNNIDAFTYFRTNHFNQDQMSIALIITLLSFAVTVILLYGTVRYRAGYLMPFFCIQVFDFCLSCLSAVGFFSYVPGVKMWIKERFDDRLPFKDDLLAMDNSYLMIVLCLIFVLALTLKAYLISMVWTCYVYINKRNMLLVAVMQENDREMALPPKYEDAINAPEHDPSLPPPPPYTQ